MDVIAKPLIRYERVKFVLDILLTLQYISMLN